MATSTIHYHNRTKSCLNPNTGSGLLRSERIYVCAHEHERSLRKTLFTSKLLGTLRTGDYVLTGLMGNEISMIVSSRYAQEMTGEHSSNTDGTLHEGIISPSELGDREDVLMTDHPGYSKEVEHDQSSDRIDSLHTPESGRTSRIGFYDISMDIDSESSQSPASNLSLEVDVTSHTAHSGRSRRMHISETPVRMSAGDSETTPTAYHTSQASTPHAMDIEMFVKDVETLSPTLLYRDTALPAGGLEDEDTDDTSHMVITGISDTHHETSVPDEGAWEDIMAWLSQESQGREL